jgi:protoheme IX farnesyltransferase
MISNLIQDNLLIAKIKSYFLVLKVRLSVVVAFSAGIGFVLGSDHVNFLKLFLVCFSGFLVTGGANIINQIKEVEFDKLMKRTQLRPLPTGNMSSDEAGILAFVLSVLGLGLQLSFVNHLTAGLSILSLILYGFVYTPLKRVGSIAVWVGALPGALPVLIGWAAATDQLIPRDGVASWLGLLVFAMQIVWQLPHFWAIAWVGDEDYTNAGFNLLLNKGLKNRRTAFFILLSTVSLLFVSIIPAYLGLVNIVSGIVIFCLGLMFIVQSLWLLKKCNRKAALMLMLGSLIYLPVVQLALVFGKY